MEMERVLNKSVAKYLPNITAYITVPNKGPLFHQVRNWVKRFTKHNHPTQGKTYYMITDIDSFLRKNHDKLTAFEIETVFTYEQIYYFGEKTPVKRQFLNKKYFQATIFDHIDFRYEVWNLLGYGSFGSVLLCYDHLENVFVAMKVLHMPRNSRPYVDREIDILEYIKLKSQQNHKLQDLFVNYIRSFEYNGYKFIVLERLDKDLLSVIHRMPGNRFLKPDTVKRYTTTIIEGLYELQKINILHRDIKPNNLLLTQDKKNLKICDFGMSCLYWDSKRAELERQLLQCKAPELILGHRTSSSIDIWSAACSIIHFCSGHSFLQGEDKSDQLTLMMEVLGIPPSKVLEQSIFTPKYFYKNNIPRYCIYQTDSNGNITLFPKRSPSGERRRLPGSRPLRSILKNNDELLLDLLSKCLDWNPDTRITPREALEHDYLKNPDDALHQDSLNRTPESISLELPAFEIKKFLLIVFVMIVQFLLYYTYNL